MLETGQYYADLMGQKQKAYEESKNLCKNLAENRKTLIEQNEGLQKQINEYVYGLQIIRRNNESLHQEAIKLAKQTDDLKINQIGYKKVQQEISKDIENIELEIKNLIKINYFKENQYLEIYDQVESLENKTNKLMKQIKTFEGKKNTENEKSRKCLKEIKKVKKEINKIMSLTNRG